MQKLKKYSVIAIPVVLAVALAWVILNFGFSINIFNIDSLISTYNRAAMSRRVTALGDGDVIALEDLTPFEWDRVYQFHSYMPADAIYGTVGYQWAHVRTGTDEMEGNIVFMRDGRVVCHIAKPFSKYWIFLGPELLATEHRSVYVSETGGYQMTLELLEET